MSILVTGAAGFIGSHLCERLLAAGHAVVGVDNFDPFYDPATKERNLAACRADPRFSLFQQDIVDAQGLRRVWEQAGPPFDAVVHLAARAGVRPSILAPAECERCNVLGTLHLLELAARSRPRPRFIFASSSSIYGNSPRIPFRETDNVDHPISPYAASKKAGELFCFTYHHLYDLPVTALRFFTVYGPRQRPDLAIQNFIVRILSGRPLQVFGDGRSSRDYTFIEDILDGVVAAIERCAGYEVINLGSHSPIPLSEMISTIESATGGKAVIERLPLQPGDVDRTYADVEKAHRLLGYAPKTRFPDGVRQQVEWYRRTLGR